MKRLLRNLLAPLACTALLASWSAPGNATLVTSRFNGAVSGYEFGFLDANAVAFDEDHPVGTAVSWSMTYDDSFLALDLSALLSATVDITGSMQVGSDQYTLTGLRFFSLGLANDFSTITRYGPQISATGPGTSDGGDFFALFWSFDPTLAMVGSPMIGYGYSNDWSTSYGYLNATGEYSVGPANQVPEPSTALLALPALLLLRRRRRA